MQEIVDGEDTTLLEAVGRADRQSHLGGAHLEASGEVLIVFKRAVQRNTCHEGSLPYE